MNTGSNALYLINKTTGKSILGKGLIPADDHSILYGLSLFETLRLYGSRPIFLDLHLDRMLQSAQFFDMESPLGKDAISSMVYETIRERGLSECAMRLTMTGGNTERQHIILTWRDIAYKNKCKEGFCCISAPFSRNKSSPLTIHKTSNSLEMLLARRYAVSNGVDEVIFFNENGCITEGSITNIFFVLKNQLYTASPRCGILPGITRKKVLEISKEGQIPCYVGEYDSSMLSEADEIFCTNSLMEIMPITSWQGRIVGNGRMGALTAYISEKYKVLIQTYQRLL